MKALIGIVATGLITALLSDNFPWWCCGIIAFVVALGLRLRPGTAFIVGLVGVALAWGMYAEWIDTQNSSILSARIGSLFGGISAFMIVVITAVIGGVVGGFGGMTGGALSALVFKKQ